MKYGEFYKWTFLLFIFGYSFASIVMVAKTFLEILIYGQSIWVYEDNFPLLVYEFVASWICLIFWCIFLISYAVKKWTELDPVTKRRYRVKGILNDIFYGFWKLLLMIRRSDKEELEKILKNAQNILKKNEEREELYFRKKRRDRNMKIIIYFVSRRLRKMGEMNV